MALTQINVSADEQNIVTGVLLLISVIVPNGGEALRRLRQRMRRTPAPPAHAPAPHFAIRPTRQERHVRTQPRKGNIMTGIRTVRRAATAALATVLAGGVLAACGSTSTNSGNDNTAPATNGATGSGGGGQIKSGLTVYYIPKDTQNPYEVLADKGGQKALSELGGKVVVSSGTQDTAAAQIPSIQAAIQAHADAIVIAANDPSALCPTLNTAAKQGIAIVVLRLGHQLRQQPEPPVHQPGRHQDDRHVRGRPARQADQLRGPDRDPLGRRERDEPERVDQVHEGSS